MDSADKELIMETKLCTVCNKYLPRDSFSIKKRNKSGLRSDCKKCAADSSRLYRKKNPQKIVDYNKKYREENPEKVKELKKNWYYKDPSKTKERNRGYYLDNIEYKQKYASEYNKTEVHKNCIKKYRKKPETKKKSVIRTRNRRLAKLKRTPVWADLKAIQDFYMNCPKGMQVDHIIPLRGKIVSGFHIVENLQYLTPYQNNKKGNRF